MFAILYSYFCQLPFYLDHMVVMMHFLSIQFPHFLFSHIAVRCILDSYFIYKTKSLADLFQVITLHLSICCTYRFIPFWNNWLRIKLRFKFKLKILVDRALFWLRALSLFLLIAFFFHSINLYVTYKCLLKERNIQKDFLHSI